MIRRLGAPGDLGWVIQAHGEIYAADSGGMARFEALVARIVADYAAGHDDAREAAWIPRSTAAGRGVCSASTGTRTRPRCCASCSSTRGARSRARRPVGRHLRRLRAGRGLCTPAAVDQRSADRGPARLSAARLRPAGGARSISSFGADMVGQTYQLDLTASRATGSDSPRARTCSIARAGGRLTGANRSANIAFTASTRSRIGAEADRRAGASETRCGRDLRGHAGDARHSVRTSAAVRRRRR